MRKRRSEDTSDAKEKGTTRQWKEPSRERERENEEEEKASKDRESDVFAKELDLHLLN